MKIKVENFRGAKKVQFEAGKITILGGPNGAAKSSVCEAVGRLLTGEPVPPGITKTRAHVLVRAGAETASCIVWDKEYEGEIVWPSCKVSSTGEMPRCSPVAAGLARPAHYIGTDGRDFWAKLLKVEVTSTDFAVALDRRGIELAPKTREDMIALITKEGAQKSYDYLKERIAELKGTWEQVSKDGRWGKDKAEKFRPVGLRTELDRPAAIQHIEDMRAKLAKMQARNIGDNVDRDRKLVRVTGKAEAVKAAEDASAALGVAERAMADLPALNDRVPIPCPHCGGPLDLIASHGGAQHSIVKMPPKDDLTPAALKERRIQRQAVEATLKDAQKAVAAANREVEEIAADEAWLRKNPETVSAGVVGEMRALEDEIATVNREIVAYDQWVEAHAKHGMILKAQQCMELVDPRGPIASEKISALILHLNSMLATVCNAASYGAVKMERSDEGVVTVTLNGRNYALLSAGEQSMVDVALQLALATVDGSQVVILDHLEALDDAGWDGAIQALDSAPFVSLVAYTQYSRKRVPDLQAAGIGVSYWMNNGEIVP